MIQAATGMPMLSAGVAPCWMLMIDMRRSTTPLSSSCRVASWSLSKPASGTASSGWGPPSVGVVLSRWLAKLVPGPSLVAWGVPLIPARQGGNAT